MAQDREQIRVTLLDADLSEVWLRAKVQQLLDCCDELERVLQAVAINAESWHCDEAGKDRALAVIAKWAKGEEAPHPGITRA